MKIIFNLSNISTFQPNQYVYDEKNKHNCQGLSTSVEKKDFVASYKEKIEDNQYFPVTFASKVPLGQNEAPPVCEQQLKNIGEKIVTTSFTKNMILNLFIYYWLNKLSSGF